MRLKKLLIVLVLLMLFTGYKTETGNYRYLPLTNENNDSETTKSDDNKLSSIKIDNHELEDFNEDIVEYDIEVDKDTTKINIEVIKKDSKAVVGGDVGTRSLSYGINTFKIK